MIAGTSGTTGGTSGSGVAEAIFSELRAGGSLPGGIEADEATAAVLCTLLGRLELEPARALLDALGQDAVRAIGSCPIHSGALGESYDQGELLRRVASHFELAPAAVRPMTAAVLSIIRRQLPAAVAEMIDEQLPGTIREMWRGAGAR
jgi:uncharacterized protein (DUF2267 family)